MLEDLCDDRSLLLLESASALWICHPESPFDMFCSMLSGNGPPGGSVPDAAVGAAARRAGTMGGGRASCKPAAARRSHPIVSPGCRPKVVARISRSGMAN